MTTTTDRILTTHVGSLPRPDDLIELLFAREQGQPYDETAMAERVCTAVAEVVAKQRAVGLDVVNDGEASKVMYSTYAQDRLAGFGGNLIEEWDMREIAEFPRLAAQFASSRTAQRARFAVCEAPLSYRGHDALCADLSNLRLAVDEAQAIGNPPADVFVTAASPGVIASVLNNRFYPSDKEFVWAAAEAMKTEYDAIHKAGFVLQLDCPDIPCGTRRGRHYNIGMEAFRDAVSHRVAALNHATRDIPAERMRMHICWGNYEGPHHYDIELKEIVDLVLEARPAGLSFEASNPRHAHEWQVWKDVDLPPGKYLIPGVIDSTTDFIEHPELVAERLTNFAGIVGPDRVMAGVDCGLSTMAGSTLVDPDVAWAKLGSLVEGTRRANERI
jgi:5-methyltetrahydropteroyltriglutamate--homocysteine methyltransferase